MKHKLKIAKKGDYYAPFYIRWSAKTVVKWMNKHNSSYYQISGKYNWFYNNKIDHMVRNVTKNEDVEVDISANSFDIYHWILRVCGYSCCIVDVKKWRDKDIGDSKDDNTTNF